MNFLSKLILDISNILWKNKPAACSISTFIGSVCLSKQPSFCIAVMPGQIADMDILHQAENAIRIAEGRARNFYGIKLPEASIDFSLRGRCAGQARVGRDGRTVIRINRQLLRENLDDFLHQTIPHEVAHLVVSWQALKKRENPRPHGLKWQTVMRDCFSLEPKRCHSYQTTPARVVTRPFLYVCSCREHHLTSIMHNRLSRSYQALCKACNTEITFIRAQC